MNEIIKKITKNKVYGHAMAACIILLVLSSVNSITKGDWNGIFNNDPDMAEEHKEGVIAAFNGAHHFESDDDGAGE